MFSSPIGIQTSNVEPARLTDGSPPAPSLDARVGAIGKNLSSSLHSTRIKVENCRSFSALRLFWWASLVWGAGAQQIQASYRYSTPTDDSADWQVESAGDLNGDGHTDSVLIPRRAAFQDKSKSNEFYVLFGGGGKARGHGLDFSLGFSKLSGILNGMNGFVVRGYEGIDFSRIAVSAGDVDGDGIDDLIIHSPSEDSSDRLPDAHVIFGAEELGKSGTFQLSKPLESIGIAKSSASDESDVIFDDIRVHTPKLKNNTNPLFSGRM